MREGREGGRRRRWEGVRPRWEGSGGVSVGVGEGEESAEAAVRGERQGGGGRWVGSIGVTGERRIHYW